MAMLNNQMAIPKQLANWCKLMFIPYEDVLTHGLSMSIIIFPTPKNCHKNMVEFPLLRQTYIILLVVHSIIIFPYIVIYIYIIVYVYSITVCHPIICSISICHYTPNIPLHPLSSSPDVSTDFSTIFSHDSPSPVQQVLQLLVKAELHLPLFFQQSQHCCLGPLRPNPSNGESVGKLSGWNGKTWLLCSLRFHVLLKLS